MNIIEKTIVELNGRIGFTPLINLQSKQLGNELQLYTQHLTEPDSKILSADVWDYLGKGGFLSHLNVKNRTIQAPPPTALRPHRNSDTGARELQLVAEDLNRNLGLIPQIDINQEQEALRKLIHDSSSLLEIEDKAELKPETWEFLANNGMLSCVTLEEQKKERQGKQKQFILSQHEKASNEIAKRHNLVEELIEKGEFTSKQIIEILGKRYFMLSMESHIGFLNILAQPEESIYSKSIIHDPATGILSFTDETEDDAVG